MPAARAAVRVARVRLLLLSDRRLPVWAKELQLQVWRLVDEADLVIHASDVLVYGHSHIPWDSTTPGGLRLLNPGSPTDRRRQPVGTVMSVEVDGGAVRSVDMVPTTR